MTKKPKHPGGRPREPFGTFEQVDMQIWLLADEIYRERQCVDHAGALDEAVAEALASATADGFWIGASHVQIFRRCRDRLNPIKVRLERRNPITNKLEVVRDPETGRPITYATPAPLAQPGLPLAQPGLPLVQWGLSIVKAFEQAKLRKRKRGIF
jgi:hypothetical protein